MKEGKSLPSFVLGELWRWCPLILSRGSCPGFGGLLRCRCGPVLSRSLGAALCSAHPMYPEFLLCGAQPPPRLGPASSHPESPSPQVPVSCQIASHQWLCPLWALSPHPADLGLLEAGCGFLQVLCLLSSSTVCLSTLN